MRSRSSEPVCSIAPTMPSAIAADGGRPKSAADPASACASPSSMSIVVDLPAPFGPSSATVSPGAIETSMPRTAWTGPVGERNDFSIPCSATAKGAIDIGPWCRLGAPTRGGEPLAAANS